MHQAQRLAPPSNTRLYLRQAVGLLGPLLGLPTEKSNPEILQNAFKLPFDVSRQVSTERRVGGLWHSDTQSQPGERDGATGNPMHMDCVAFVLNSAG